MKMWKSVVLAAVMIVFSITAILLAAPSATAQSLERGEIRGVVYDSSHGLVVGATVTISNPSTGYQTRAYDGYDRFLRLRPVCFRASTKSKRRRRALQRPR